MYKYIALDLDGTLLNSKKEISPRTKEALLSAQEKGYKVIIISGRPYSGMKKIADELELSKYFGYVCSYNGGTIRCANTKELLYSDGLTEEEVANIYDVSKAIDCKFMTYDENDDVYANGIDEGINHEVEINDLELKEELRIKTSPKVLLSASEEKTKENLVYLNEKIGNKYNVVCSYKLFIEINPAHVHKGEALMKLMNVLEDDISNVVAFGDAGNDKTMVEMSGLGVAMGNAQDEVKQVADKITKTNDEDGIVKILDELGMM